MASIIKNQLVKHLSKFTRDLKPEQISLDVLKGKSKLKSVVINEEVLTDILELPSWLRIKRAYCTGVTVSVPWTRLKSSPVQIYIDEIQVEVVLATGEPIRKSGNGAASFADGSYGFVDKVVEGMSLYINTVEINFDSDAFGGSFMLSRLSVESRTPGWQHATDLRQTRIACSIVGKTLMYKQISWHLLRIEASAKSERHEKRATINAPLRLITSGGKIRIALKKNSADGSVIHARIQMILEDILWVATLPQLKSAIAFYSYIMSLVEQSAQRNSPVVCAPSRVSTTQDRTAQASRVFQTFDFDQTSHHLHVKKIDLHLCDDANANSGYPPEWDIENGAMQVTLSVVLIDVYPHTLATSDRSHWVRYAAPNAFTQWIQSRLKANLESLQENLDDSAQTRLARTWPMLMSLNVVIRVYDVVVQCVSEISTKKDNLQNLLTSERQIRQVPSDQYIIHFEFASFFHPMSDQLQVPAPCSYLQFGPFSLQFDRRTLRWCLYVAHNLSKAADILNLQESDQIARPDMKIEILMPKLIIAMPDPSSDRRLPHRLLLSLSTLSLTNCQPGNNESILDGLNQHLLDYMKAADTLSSVDRFLSCEPRTDQPPTVRDEQFWLQTSPAWVDTDHGPKTKPLPVVSDVCLRGSLTISSTLVNVYIEPSQNVAVILDHFQFLQLTRLSASLSTFVELLSRDQLHFTAGVDSPSPTIVLVAALKKIHAHVLLTMGSLPSPYDGCPAITEPNYLDVLSETTGNSGCNSPGRVASSTPLLVEERRTKVAIVVQQEEFPEFPTQAQEFDSSSYVDDSMSIATSLEDESTFDFEIPVEDDLFPVADLAEEAGTIDEEAVNDRIYKSIMAKNGNVLRVDLEEIVVLVNVVQKDVRVLGSVDRLHLNYDLNLPRQSVYDVLSVRSTSAQSDKLEKPCTPQVDFCVDAPASTTTSFVKATVTGLKADLDDEIVSHLSAFALDEQVTENRVRLAISVESSSIEIKDRKKKQPLRIRIKDCVIEQDEDMRNDV